MPGFRIDQAAAEEYALELPNGKDIKRAHRWRINRLGPTLGKDDLLFAKSITMPNIAFGEDEVLGGSIAYKFAKRPEFGDLVIAFYDVDGLEPKVREWQSKVWSPTAGIGKADDYKDSVELFLTDGYGDPVDSSWKFINAWPKGINHGELTYDTSDFKLLTVTISYDWIEYPNMGVQGAGAKASRAVSQAASSAAQANAQLANQAMSAALSGINPGLQGPSTMPSQIQVP